MESPLPNDRTWLALHQACLNKEPLGRIQELVQAQPSALSHWATPPSQEDPLTTLKELRLPLHVACESGASLQVIQYLVQQDPSSLHALAAVKMYTALDFALYYFHSLPSDNTTNRTQAEAVVNFLAKASRNKQQQSMRKQSSPTKSSITTTTNKKQAVFRRKSKSSKIIRIRLPSSRPDHLHLHHHHAPAIPNQEVRMR